MHAPELTVIRLPWHLRRLPRPIGGLLAMSLLPALLLALPASAQAQVPVDLLQGGDLAGLRPGAEAGASSRRPLPWWRSSKGTALVQPQGGVLLGPGDWLEQPAAFPASEAAGLRLQVITEGAGVLVLQDGAGRQARRALEDPGLELDGAQLEALLGAPVTPRLVVRLEPVEGDYLLVQAASLTVELTDPGVAALAQDLRVEVAWVLDLWRKHAADVQGPARTAFPATLFDVLTGAPVAPLLGQHSVVADLWLAAARLGVPGAEETNAALVEELLTRGLHPDTGLPQRFDCVLDRPRPAEPMEVHAFLRYLVDLADEGAPGLGPELRERAAAAARQMATAVLHRGVLPDGQVAARYRPDTGQPDPSYPAIRRLDVPAALAEVARREGLEQPPVALVDAVAQVLYTHLWVGDWHEIDPGFDDNFGHYGARGVTLWRAFPEQRLFRELGLSGWRYYAPRWGDALRWGGNIAADQVRCWRIFAELAELEPSLVPELAPLLRDALLVHWKGEQYDGGSWGDVTVRGFDPKGHLQVGDTKGVPQNLLSGLAVLYERRFAEAAGGMGLAELRARAAVLLGSTGQAYRRPFGYLSTRAEVAGVNPCGGELRVAAGLVELLQALERAHPELVEGR